MELLRDIISYYFHRGLASIMYILGGNLFMYKTREKYEYIAEIKKKKIKNQNIKIYKFIVFIGIILFILYGILYFKFN